MRQTVYVHCTPGWNAKVFNPAMLPVCLCGAEFMTYATPKGNKSLVVGATAFLGLEPEYVDWDAVVFVPCLECYNHPDLELGVLGEV